MSRLALIFHDTDVDVHKCGTCACVSSLVRFRHNYYITYSRVRKVITADSPHLQLMSQARQTAVPGLRRRLASHRTRGTALRRPTACGVQQPPPRVVVLGGGFGGLYTALRLASLPWTRAPEARPGTGAVAVWWLLRARKLVARPRPWRPWAAEPGHVPSAHLLSDLGPGGPLCVPGDLGGPL